MPIFKFGYIIKSRREEMGYTQEELADGICSVPTLSRIENGERMPSKENFEALLQRLGYSNAELNSFVDEKAFTKHELKFQLRQAVILKQMDKAAELFEKYQESVSNPPPIDRQSLILYEVLTHPSKYTLDQRLAPFKEALRLTCPKYEDNYFPALLSYEEIILINNIAVAHFYAEAKEKAINLLFGLKRYYENHIINPEEALRTQPLVLYNLSKYLGLVERFDESIEVSNQGIRVCVETGRCTMLPKLFFNHAWALIKRGYTDDFGTAKQSTKKAYYLAVILKQSKSADLYLRFFIDTFGEEMSL